MACSNYATLIPMPTPEIHQQHYESTESTNDIAKRWVKDHPHNPLVVSADTQSAGRGQHRAAWVSEPGGLYYTCLIPKAQDVSPEITLEVAAIVQHLIHDYAGIMPEISAPNDLMVAGKKLCGILVETLHRAGSHTHLIIGIGINVNQASFPDPITDIAVSLYELTGEKRDLDPLKESLTIALLARFWDAAQR